MSRNTALWINHANRMLGVLLGASSLLFITEWWHACMFIAGFGFFGLWIDRQAAVKP